MSITIIIVITIIVITWLQSTDMYVWVFVCESERGGIGSGIVYSWVDYSSSE